MAIITGLTAAEMREIEANSIVDGDVVGDNLILTKHDGTTINAGMVRGPVGADASAIIAEMAPTDVPADYPIGISVFSFATTGGWPTTYATVTTVQQDVSRAYQLLHQKTTGAMWIRTAADNFWGSWMKTVQQDTNGLVMVNRLQILVETDVSDTSTGAPFQIGDDPGANIVMDGNEIIARNNGVGAVLYVENGINTATAPTADDHLTRKDYVDAEDLFNRRIALAQRLMSGGGARSVTSTGISWATRFIVMGLGKNSASSSGYFDITMPPDGTVIPLLGNAATTATVTGGKVPLTGWQALYYDLPLGGALTSDPARFRILDYSLTSAEVPDSWILICVRNNDANKQAPYLWGDGVRQDYWKAPTLLNSWVNYGSSWPGAAWRFTHEGKIECRGLVKSGLTGVTKPIFTLSGLGPEGTSGVGALNMQPCNGGSCRMDVLGTGDVVLISFNTGGTNAHVSLEGLSWFPDGV